MTGRIDYPGLEILKLTAQQYPLPCSLKARVTQHFADGSLPTDAGLAMDAEELIGYLRNMDYESFYPMEGILAQTEAIGDPALPTKEQGAILHWLDAAMKDWDRHFPFEEPLAAEDQKDERIESKDCGPGTEHDLLQAVHRPRPELPELYHAIVGVAVQHPALLGPVGTVATQHPALQDKEEEEPDGQPANEPPAIAAADHARHDCYRKGQEAHKETDQVPGLKAAHQAARDVAPGALFRGAVGTQVLRSLLVKRF